MRAFSPALLILLVTAVASVRAEKLVVVAGGGLAERDAPATECRLREPFGAEFTPAGELVIVEMEHGNRVLKVDGLGVLHVLAGTGEKGYSGDGGPATAATFNGLHCLAITPGGDVLLADCFNHALRKIDASTGIITTLAGNGKKGFAGDGGPAAQAQFSSPIQIALDPAGSRLYCTELGNRRVRRIDLSTGLISTVAGNGQGGAPTDGALAVESPLADPRAVAPDVGGGFYVLERSGNALCYVDPAGRIRTVAGTGAKGFSGDGGPALKATMNGPKFLALDHDGTVLIADTENQVIRRYAPKTGLMTRVAGTGKSGAGGLGGPPQLTELARPHGLTVARDGSLYITDSYNDRVLKLIP